MSSSDSAWRRFTLTLLTSTGAVLAALFTAIVLIDPLDHLAVSLPIERAPVNQNQRFSYPALARSTRFDSAIIGTSTARLLDPGRLDQLYESRFVNLAMNSATAYEQSRIFELFVAHHRDAQHIVIGIDIVWCESEKPIERYTFREFPEWLYDSNPLNDYLHLLNGKTLEQAARLLEFLAGRREPRYAMNGYRNFLPSADEYDLEKARHNIYGQATPLTRTPAATPPVPAEVRADWQFPAHELLEAMLSRVSPQTRVTLFFVPYHRFNLPSVNSRDEAKWQECKRRIGQMAQARPAVIALDFMRPSPITSEDANYWDPLHFNDDVAQWLERTLAAAARGEPLDPTFVVALTGS